jgi:hypothetical protein
MSKWLMRGHFGHLNFKTFPMRPRTLKCEDIWPLKLSSEFSRVPEDSIFPLLGVWIAFSHLAPKWGCDTLQAMFNPLSIIFIYSCKYFFLILLPWNAISKFLYFFKFWCDPKFKSITYKKDLFKDWSSAHLEKCSWYLNYLPNPKELTQISWRRLHLLRWTKKFVQFLKTIFNYQAFFLYHEQDHLFIFHEFD